MENRWKVKKSERGMTLENFIYSKMADWSHKDVKRAIDDKRAFVNGQNVFISKWNLKPNAVVEFKASESDRVSADGGRYRYVDIIFEDNYMIAANKPAHVDFERFADTIKDYLHRKNNGQGHPYVGLMHRLDKETSGIMLFTKKKIANGLADQFRDHTIRKFYLALVDGLVDAENGEVRLPLQKGEFEDGKKVRIALEGPGQRAITRFNLLERYENASLLRVEILTGRTHQIRVHLSETVGPIIGDKLYGRKDGIDFPRHALHAERIDFRHPVTGDAMRLSAPLPPDMQKLLGKLRMIDE